MAPFLRSPLLTILLLAMLFSSIPIEARENTMFSKVTHHHRLKKSVIFVGTSKNNVGEDKVPTVEAPPDAASPSPSSTSESEDNEYYSHQTGFSTPETNEEEDLVLEGEGMSATRFVEGGKYYYGVGSEHERERDGKTKKSQRYVFDTMEEYEQYEESQSHYVP